MRIYTHIYIVYIVQALPFLLTLYEWALDISGWMCLYVCVCMCMYFSMFVFAQDIVFCCSCCCYASDFFHFTIVSICRFFLADF